MNCTFIDRLIYTESERIRPDFIWSDPNERMLYCGKCNEYTPHVWVTTGWACAKDKCGEYIPQFQAVGFAPQGRGCGVVPQVCGIDTLETQKESES